MMPASLSLSCLTACFVLANDCHAQDFQVERERIGETVRNHILASSFQGAVLVAAGDEIVFRGAYGEADKGEGLHNTSGTRFCLASLTKQFTATAALRLVEAGQLDLSTPVGRYLPELRGPVATRVTVHHLLTHTSGLPWGVEALSEKGPMDPFSTTEIIELVSSVELSSEPGEKFRYSDLGYVIAAAVIESVTGKSYGEILDEFFFDPLGMDDSYDESVMDRSESRAKGHVWKEGDLIPGEPEDKSYVTGAGSVWSTAEDLLLWSRRVQQGQVLSSASLTNLVSAKVDGYSYGWKSFSYGEPGTGVSHTGLSRCGFSSALRWYLDDELTIIVLSNAHFAGKTEFVDAIGEIMLPTQDVVSPEQVDALFSQWNWDTGPGAAVAIVKDGQLVLEKGYGMANLEHWIEITPETVFPIASVTKQFTGFAVAALAADGALSLDDEVRSHLPELPDFGASIKIRDLIHHTSGLRDVVELLLISGFDFRDLFSKARYWNLIRNQQALNFPPGSEYEYTNTGYFLLAEIVAKVSGVSFRDWLEREVFEPLDMNSSQVVTDPGTLIRNLASAYQGRDGDFRRSQLTSGVAGGSGIYSTAGDLARWLINFGTQQAGGPEVITRMQETGRMASGQEVPYAFGISIDDYQGLARISHGGRSNGYLSHVAYFPEQRFGVAVLCNGYPMQPLLDPAVLADQIADLYLAKSLTEQRPDFATEEAIDVSKEQLTELEGLYWSTNRNYTRWVSWSQGALYFEGSGSQQRMLPLGENRFLLQGATPRTVLSFRKTEAGEREFEFAAGNQPLQHFIAVDEPDAITPESLQDYAGLYFSPELKVAHRYSVSDGQLQVECTGRETATLRPIIRDHFNQGNPWWLGYDIHFVRDEKGKVTEVYVSNYHAKKLRFVKR